MLGVRWCQGRQQVGVWTRWWGVRVRWCQGRQQVGGMDEVVGCEG